MRGWGWDERVLVVEEKLPGKKCSLEGTGGGAVGTHYRVSQKILHVEAAQQD